MILRVLLLMLVCLPFSQTPLQADWFEGVKSWFGKKNEAAQPMVRVLVANNVDSVDLEVRGQYSLYDPFVRDSETGKEKHGEEEWISTRFAGKNRPVQMLDDGLKWGEAFPGQYQLKITLDKPESVALIDGKPYAGNLYIYGVEGKVSVINEVPMESYVYSVLSQCQVPTEGQPEALAALAIAARTNAYYQSINPKTKYWAVEANKTGFAGNCVPQNSDLKRAVDVTSHMMMSRTGVYEGVSTPFAAQFGPLQGGRSPKEVQEAKISFEEANEMANQGEHAAQILFKAFPGTTIILMR